MRVLTKAQEAGADWLVLCDTNGGTMPERGARDRIHLIRAASCRSRHPYT